MEKYATHHCLMFYLYQIFRNMPIAIGN